MCSRFRIVVFLTAVRPRVAIVSGGVHNRYGHPSQHVIDALTVAGYACHAHGPQW
jgi:competence protein ComEC